MLVNKIDIEIIAETTNFHQPYKNINYSSSMHTYESSKKNKTKGQIF